MKAVAALSTLCAVCVGLVIAVGGTAAPGPCEASDVRVRITGYAYSPASVTVAPNDTVCWTNEDAVDHTVTSNAPGGFDSGSLSTAESFRQTFTAEGTFAYHCIPHGMNAEVVVTSSPPPPPPPGPPPPGPPPPPPPPSPPPPAPPPHLHPLALQGLRISVERRGRTRLLVARARVNQPVRARLALLRANRVRASARKQWATGPNTIRATLPRTLPKGRWTAELRVGKLRFKRIIRIG